MSARDWSSAIQGIDTLDLSRELRFRDDRRDLLLRTLRLQRGMTVVDCGCGPGAVTRKLAAWLGPRSLVIGVDRDAAFIRHARATAARQRLPHAHFVLGDILSLPLADASVDACTSHTVIEHVPNREFLREQQRVCRPGGVVSVMMTVVPETATMSPGPAEIQPDTRESELWEPLRRAGDAADQALGVAAHRPAPGDLPRLFTDLGFDAVQVDAVALSIVADDARNTPVEQRAIIDADRRIALERIEMGGRLAGEAVTPAHLADLRSMVEERFARRLAMADRGEPAWDFQLPLVLVVSGQA